MQRVPRYHALADALRRDIRAGRYPVGSLLPTELEICRAEAVSRHTARDALRLLIEEGLVERRQGAGTRVIATERPAGFIQPLGGPQELMQYARDARLVVKTMTVRRLTVAERDWLGEEAENGDGWLVVDGVRRREGGEVLAATCLYIPAAYADIRADLRSFDGAAQELIAARHGVSPEHIEQEIHACLLDKARANELQAEPNSAALRTYRRYLDAKGGIVVASDSLHPADRFAYQMTYHRES